MQVYVVKTDVISQQKVNGVVVKRTLLDTVIAIVPESLAPLVIDGVTLTEQTVAVDTFFDNEFADGVPVLGESWVSNPESL